MSSMVRIVTVFCLLFVLSGCEEGFWTPGSGGVNGESFPDGDNPASPNDNPGDGINTTIRGNIIAVDRETDVELTPSQFEQRAGGMILYIMPSAQDNTEVFAKVIIEEPGPYEVTLEGYVGTFDVSLVVDDNNNQFIDAGDTAREYAHNPLLADGNTHEDVDVYVDLPSPGPTGPPTGGGPDGINGDPGDVDDDEAVIQGCEYTLIEGTVNINGYPEGNIAVTTNSADFLIGPREVYVQAGSGPFSAAECNSAEYTALLAYLDADNNGYFEPSDPIGEAASNPYVLGAGNISGIQINIPAPTEVEFPQPPLYVPITGQVAYSAFAGGDILVHASHVSAEGLLYSTATLAAPGPFSIIAPANTEDVLIWAVLDHDGDGVFDLWNDPFASVGPLNTGNGVTQIGLDLSSGIPMGEFGGTVVYTGQVGTSDVLRIDVQTQLGIDVPPILQMEQANPQFPFEYNFDDVPTGTYWISAQLDIGGDNPTFPPGPEDPLGNIGPLLLAPGGSITTASFQLLVD